jgi:hypothetical protein
MDFESYLTAAVDDNGASVSQHIASGFSPDLTLPNGEGGTLSLLHLVTFQGFENSTKALLDGGANPDILDSGGEPPLKMAIVRGNVRVVKMLLQNGANANMQMRDGNTPLHVAAMAKEKEIAQILLDHGADMDVENSMGITPRQVAGFQDMKTGGWDVSKPNAGADMVGNMENLNEEGLMGMLMFLPAMINARILSGEITAERGAMLKAALNELEEAAKLPLEIRSTRMKELTTMLLTNLGMPQGFL